MSLLNDALRAAEQRQNRPAAPGAYVGGRQPARNGRPWLLSVLVVLVLLTAGVGGYWTLVDSPSPQPVVVEKEPSADEPSQDEAVVVVEERLDDRAVEALKPEPRQEPPESVSAQNELSGPAPAQPEPEVIEPEVSQPEPTAVSASPVPEAPANQEVKAAEADRSQPEEMSTAGVKQVPETPAAVDRSTARELERLVAQGNITDAERGLAALTREQAAPRSRYVVARALLVDGKQDQALGWLPEGIAVEYPRLRLLRARAQHANNNLAAAVDTLNSSVPPVEEHAEYRVTLATLLQQQGKNGEAARHWAELIAWDDSQAPWWVGLAIALEAQGEQAAAARAYTQAAELPGLPRSLADYVRQRLQALQAG